MLLIKPVFETEIVLSLFNFSDCLRLIFVFDNLARKPAAAI